MNPDAVHASQLFRLGEKNIGERAELDEQPASRYGRTLRRLRRARARAGSRTGHALVVERNGGDRARRRSPRRRTAIRAIQAAESVGSRACITPMPSSSTVTRSPRTASGSSGPSNSDPTLDNEVAPRCSATQSSNLTPQPTLDQREVQVAYRLALDQGEIIDRVVAGAERFRSGRRSRARGGHPGLRYGVRERPRRCARAEDAAMGGAAV